jgi:truncated hemoglobin YjbI
MQEPRRRAGDVPPDPELWAALGEGALLRRALADFYERVYADERLAPFFRFTPRARALERQYAFLKEVVSGEACYLGDRPHNAHHWMVISNELFDHRQRLLDECLRGQGLAEAMIARLRAVAEVFRGQVVKDAPKPRRLRGEALPLEGSVGVEIASGTRCDGCGSVLEEGQAARYEVGTGRTCCVACSLRLEAGPSESRPAPAAGG